jgi:DNA primase
MATDRSPLLDYAAIRARISIADVLALVNDHPLRTQASQCRGRCPLHQRESHRERSSTCFSVNLQRNLFKCFGCGAQGNQIDLWRLHIRLPLYQATLELCQRLNIAPPTKRIAESESRNSKTTPTATKNQQN